MNISFSCTSFRGLSQNHRIPEYPALKKTHKDHWNPAPGPAQNSPENLILCLRALPKCFLNSAGTATSLSSNLIESLSTFQFLTILAFSVELRFSFTLLWTHLLFLLTHEVQWNDLICFRNIYNSQPDIQLWKRMTEKSHCSCSRQVFLEKCWLHKHLPFCVNSFFTV